MMYVAIYLLAIIIANLSIATFGPSMAIVNAFLLIGLDFVARDKLHDAWHGRHLWPRMAALIIAGSLISYVLNPAVARIALASCLAFGAAGLVDAFAYSLLRDRSWLVRSNGSNVPSAVVDSVVFVSIAFGGLSWVILGQVAAKIIGGAVWSMVLRRKAWQTSLAGML